MPADCVVILIRHGDSIAFQNNLGDQDVPRFRQSRSTRLAPIGFEKAQKVHDFIQQWKIKPDLMYTSPFIRALETAHCISNGMPFYPHSDEIYREIDRQIDGEEVGEKDRQYRLQRGKAFRERNMNWRYSPTDESPLDWKNRANSIKHHLEETCLNKMVAIVGHSQIFGSLMCSMEHGDNPSDKLFFEYLNSHFMAHCAISQLTLKNGIWKMRHEDYNYVGHLK